MMHRLLARPLATVSGLSLDLRLGARMLVKYPGLTVVGGLAMAFGIWFGAVTFEMLGMLLSPTLPLPGGDRVVEIRNWDVRANRAEGRALHDFAEWRGSVRSITDLGAWRDFEANLVGPDGSAHPAVAAEISASAFRIAPAQPALGRVLEDSDERVGAPSVVVIGYDLWQRRFAADPQVIGRSVQIGTGYATVVGVMPEHYGFPISHELWMPLRDAPAPPPRTGPPVTVFGRLAPGADLEQARAELAALGQRVAAASPTTHQHLQTQVLRYPESEANTTDELAMMALIYFFVVALVVVVCSTVALLMFARAASRETEITVRSALGASRARIVTQLFAEALVLGAVATVVALAAAQLTLSRWGRTYLEINLGRLPFWYDFTLSPATILAAFGLTVLGAAIAGVIPARKITHGIGARLKVGTSGGGGVSFGGVWTAVIVVQVALTVAFPAVVALQRAEMNRIQSFDVGFRSEEFLAVRLDPDPLPPEAFEPGGESLRMAHRDRFMTSMAALRRRVEAEPGVAGVTFVDRLPRDMHREDMIDVATLPGETLQEVSFAFIEPSYFDVLQAPVRAGRAFTTADLGLDARVVIVDEGFVETVMQGRNPIGHQVWFSEGRTADPQAPDRRLYEIVGLVKDLGMAGVAQARRVPGVYFPAPPGGIGETYMMVHAAGDPLTLAPRVRALMTEVDPTIRLSEVQRVDQVASPHVWFVQVWIRITIGLTAITLLLSLAGIYAVLAFTVSRRTREIGVRIALGASARKIVTSIFRRPLTQVSIGVMVGSLLVGLAAVAVEGSTHFRGNPPGLLDSPGDVAVLVLYAAFMFAVCMLACIVPTWRALRVQPTEALRAD